ncbi:DapH/DapD/GlmU-related protein [Brevibacillus ginsengisoli]|uniref:DapH/DapD/GlmU-related protein n=1 Tax=Brevibacillus ginsengisoli TaxID=363854 RepID=UPI003CEF0D30
MSAQLQRDIKASWLAEKLGLTLLGKDTPIQCICPVHSINDHSLTFSVIQEKIQSTKSYAVIGSAINFEDNVSVLVSAHPRLDFARALQIIDDHVGFQPVTSLTCIHPTVRIGKNSIIGQGVSIGEHTTIGQNVVIENGVTIGRNCLIKSCAVIGEEGFGMERDLEGVPIRIKQLGSVVIGDDVEIGSFSTVCRGSLQNTIISDHVKIDDHVHVGHNCFLDESSILTAGVILGGGCRIGKNVWMGLNAVTLQKVTIGDHAFIGIGAVVLQNVLPNEKVFGNPARKVTK